MRKLVLTSLILVLGFTATFAQKVEKVKAHKKTFITKRLALTAEEADKFWPVYDKYDEKIYQVRVVERKSYMKQIKEKGGVDQLTDKEAEDVLRKLNESQQKLSDLEQAKFKELEQIISAKKMLKLYRAERIFKKELLKKMKGKKGKGMRMK